MKARERADDLNPTGRTTHYKKEPEKQCLCQQEISLPPDLKASVRYLNARVPSVCRLGLACFCRTCVGLFLREWVVKFDVAIFFSYMKRFETSQYLNPPDGLRRWLLISGKVSVTVVADGHGVRNGIRLCSLLRNLERCFSWSFVITRSNSMSYSERVAISQSFKGLPIDLGRKFTGEEVLERLRTCLPVEGLRNAW